MKGKQNLNIIIYCNVFYVVCLFLFLGCDSSHHKKINLIKRKPVSKHKTCADLFLFPEFRKADSLYKEIELEKAALEYIKHKKFFKNKNKEKYIYALLSCGRTFYRLSKPADAIKELYQALEEEESLNDSSSLYFGPIYVFLGKSYRDIIEPDSALHFLNKGLNFTKKYYPGNMVVIADIYDAIGKVHKNNFSDYLNAEKYFLRCRKILETLEKPDPEDLISCYLHLASIYKAKNDLERALNYSFKSLSISNSQEKYREFWSIDCYNFIGNIYQKKKDYSKSIIYYRKALDLAKAYGRHDENGLVYDNIGATYFLINEFDEANYFYKKGLKAAEKAGSKQSLSGSLLNLGELHQRLGNLDSSLFYFASSLKLKQELYGGKNSDIGTVYLYLGRLFKETKKYDSALILFQKVFISSIDNFNEFNITTNPSAAEIAKDQNFIDALFNKSKIFQQLHMMTGSYEHLTKSLNCYLLLDSVLEITKQYQDDEFAKLAANETNKAIYSEAINVCFKLYNKNKEKHYVFLAFAYMEKCKANLLWENLKDLEVYTELGVADSLKEKESHLKAQLAYYKNKNATDSDGNFQTINDKIFSLTHELDELKEKIEIQNPSYFKIKYASSHASLDVIQERAIEESFNLIEYHKTGEEVFVIAIGNKNLAFHKIQNSQGLDLLIYKFKSLLSTNINHASIAENHKEFKETAFGLYAFLLKDILENADFKTKNNDWVIVPDETIALIPFEALIKERATNINSDFKNLPYLVKFLNLRYAHSASIFIDPFKKKKLLPLIAFDYEGEGNFASHEADIKGSVEELELIKKAFQKGEFYRGSAASEDNFKQKSSSVKIIHLAIHGVADTLNPLNSRLIFKKGLNTKEDGILYYHELYNLRFQASLIVLSACETGVGKTLKGEGTMSLGRAFKYSGAASIVTSLWKINDRITAKIMGDFYNSLSKGMDISRAMNKSKICYLENADEVTAHPGNWAGFVTYSNIDENVISPKLSILYLASVFLLIIFLILILILKKTGNLPVFSKSTN